jgi:hypothetical protein
MIRMKNRAHGVLPFFHPPYASSPGDFNAVSCGVSFGADSPDSADSPSERVQDPETALQPRLSSALPKGPHPCLFSFPK